MKYYLFIYLLFSLSLSFANNYCPKVTPNEDLPYQDIQEYIETELESLANSSLLAGQADIILGKLIGAKSPIIITWMAKRKFNPQTDEVKIVKEWRKYYLENFILGKFPTKTIATNSLVEKSFSKINKEVFTKKIKNHYRKIFKEAKSSALMWISKSALKIDSKSLINTKIEKIGLYFFEKLQDTRYQNKPLEFLRWGVAYSPLENQINIGIDMVKKKSEATVFAIFAHEIAHSFDPCRYSAFFKKINPFAKVISCLRSDKATGAKYRDDSLMPLYIKKGQMTKQLSSSLLKDKTCNKVNYPPSGYQKDQILEVFSDWFSAELVAMNKKYIKKNLRTDLCKQKKLMPGSSYLSNHDRLFKIYLTQPVIRKAVVGVSQKAAHYCPMN